MYEIRIKSKKEIKKNEPRSSDRERVSDNLNFEGKNIVKKQKKQKKTFKKILSLLVVITFSTVLSTVMMHATNGSPFSESVLGLVWSGKSNKTEPCPDGMSYVSSAEGAFCIDTYTASTGEMCPNSLPSSQSETEENIEKLECVPVSKPNAMPWRNISQTQAQELCQKAGKFLPGSEHWFYSARGTPTKKPWSSSDCNLDNNWVTNPGLTGSAENCVSYAGVYDMVGNVWEWVDGTVRDGKMDSHTFPESGYITSVDATGLVLNTDPNQPDENYTKDRFWINPEGTRGVMRGGFHGSNTDGGVYSTHAEMTPDFAGRAVGFRCASEVLR